MNDNSKNHGVKHDAAERFFGLGDYCRHQTKAAHAHMGCEEPLGPNPTDEQPLSTSYKLAALCNSTVNEMMTRWYAQVSGRTAVCTWGLRTPPRSRCAWVRAIKQLRHQYTTASAPHPSLSWFEGSGPHVAIHIRRGDIRKRDPGRYISNERWSRIIGELGSVLSGMCLGTQTSDDRRLQACLRDAAPLVRPSRRASPTSLGPSDLALLTPLPFRSWCVSRREGQLGGT